MWGERCLTARDASLSCHGMKREITLDALSALLASRKPAEMGALEGETRAAVALLLCWADPGSHIEILFIERPRHDGDPWSGHIAFPGGKVEPTDADPRAAAARETREEIGIDLASMANCIGQLDDQAASILPMIISGFVYSAPSTPPPVVLGDEVRSAFWFPLSELANPSRQTWHLDARSGSRHAAIDLRLPQIPLLWGVTYRLAIELLRLAGLSSPRHIR